MGETACRTCDQTSPDPQDQAGDSKSARPSRAGGHQIRPERAWAGSHRRGARGPCLATNPAHRRALLRRLPRGRASTVPCHRGTAVVDLGQVAVMGRTCQRHVPRRVVASKCESPPVVVLDRGPRRAAASLTVHEPAAALIPLVHFSSNRGRDVTRGGRHVGVPDSLPGSLRPPEAAALQPLELLGHGDLDHRGEVAVRGRGSHQRLQTLELLAQLGRRRELDLVASRRKRLDHGGWRTHSRRTARNNFVQTKYGLRRRHRVGLRGSRGSRRWVRGSRTCG